MSFRKLTMDRSIFVDTHAHLNFPEFKDDYQKVVKRARKAGVRAIINVGTSYDASRRAIEIAHEYPKGIYASVALHPIYAHKEFDYQAMKKLASDEKVVAIGETGLDFSRSEKTKDLQKKLFERHLVLAREIRKPLIFHCRDGRSDFVKIIKKYAGDFESARIRGVVHCFTGDWEFAKEILDLNLMISYIGIITFTKNLEQIEAVKKIPLDRLMIETDSPLVAPEPYRGKINEPAYVVEIAKKIAELKNISIEEVAEQTTKNAVEFFKIQLLDGDSVVIQLLFNCQT